MPSPFPGMDPFIEGQRWRDFHTTFITVIREMLTPRVRPRSVVEVEEYVYLARVEEEKRSVRTSGRRSAPADHTWRER